MKFPLHVNKHTKYILTMFSTNVIYVYACNAVGLTSIKIKKIFLKKVKNHAFKENMRSDDFNIYIFQGKVSTCS